MFNNIRTKNYDASAPGTPGSGGDIAVVTKSIGDLKTALDAGQTKTESEIKTVKDSVTAVQTSVDEVKNEQEEIKKQVNIIKAKAGRTSSAPEAKGFNDLVKGLVVENADKFKGIADGSIKSFSFKLETKAAGDMTAPNSLTGDYPKEYHSEIISLPSAKTHLRQLFGVGATGERTHTFYQETAVEGGVAAQTAEGATKSKIEFKLTEKDAPVKTIAGHTVISRQLLFNVPGMSSFFTKRLPELFYKEEDRQLLVGTGLNGELSGLIPAIPAASTTADAYLDAILDTIGEIEDTDEDVNAMLFRPADFYKILKVSTLNKPDVVVIDPATGRLTIAGIPAFKSTSVPAGTAIIGDYNLGADILQLTNVNVAISWEDGDNFKKNMATVRVEAEEAFPIYRPNAFRKLTLPAIEV